MWTSLLGVVVVVMVLVQSLAGAVAPLEKEVQDNRDHETENPDTPYVLAMGFQIQSIVERLLETQQEKLDRRFSQLQEMMATCSGSGQEQAANIIPEEFDTKMAEVTEEFIKRLTAVAENTVQDLEDKLDTFSNNILSRVEEDLSPLYDRMDQLEQEISALATQSDLVEMKSELSTQCTTSFDRLENRTSILATHNQLSANTRQLETQITELKEVMNDHCIASAGDNKEILAEVLAAGLSNNEKMDDLIEAARSEPSDNVVTLLSDLKELVVHNDGNLNGVSSGLDNMASLLEARLTALEDTVDVINNNTQPPPPPPPITTTTTTTTTTTPSPPATVNPCVDSEFRGSSPSLAVCTAAVRFKKCHLQFVAYHCCRSCTDAGQIEEMGPWRYLNYPRKVTILQALNYMRP